MKKIVAKEFLWLLLFIFIAVFLTYLFLSCIDLISGQEKFTPVEKIFVIELFLIGFLLNLSGLYLIRLIVAAFKTIAKK